MFFRNQFRYFLPVVFCLLPLTQIFAQSSTDDSLSLIKTINNAVDLYYQSSGDQSRLYNGTEYTGYPFSFVEGSPFFLTNQPQRGSVMYDGVEYRDVNLQYDELSGLLIMQDENHRIQLSNDRISGFAIGNNPFIRFVKDSLSPPEPETGFYNILYDGQLSVLKKGIKNHTPDLFLFTGGNPYNRCENQFTISEKIINIPG